MIGGGFVLGSFQARLGLDAKDYARGMINAEASSRVFGNTFTSFVSSPLLGSIELFKNVGRAAVLTAGQILGNAEAVERLSQQTGISVPLLIALQKRLDLAGFSAERSRQSLLFFNRFVADYNRGGPVANEVLAQMGVNLDGISGNEAVFRAMVEGLEGIEDTATRAALAGRVFGEEAGIDLVNAIGGGNAAIDQMIDNARRLGFVIDDATNTQLAALNTNIGLVNQAIDGIRINFLRELILELGGAFDGSKEGIIGFAENINNNLTPAAKDLAVVLEATLATLSAIASVIKVVQDFFEKGAFGAFVAADRVETFLREIDISPEAQRRRRLQERNRERGQEYIEEMGL